MALAATLISNLNVTTNVASYSSVAVNSPSGAANTLLVAFIEAPNAGTPVDPTSVTGNGVTWSRKDTRNSSIAHLGVYVALGAGASATVLTVDWGGVTQQGMRIAVVEFTGVEISGGALAGI